MNYYFLDFIVNNETYTSERITIYPDNWLRKKYKGEPLEFDLSIRLPKGRGKLIEYLDNSQLLLILREDFVEVLQSFEKINIEKYEVSINREIDLSYYYVHTLNNLNAVDLEASEAVHRIPGIPVYSEIKNLHLNKEIVGDRHFFRANEMKTMLIVSEELKNALEELEIFEHVSFTPCEGYHYGKIPNF